MEQFFGALFVVSGVHLPFLGIYLRGLGFSYTGVGLLYLAIPLARTIGPLIWGPMADARGIRHRIVWLLGSGALVSALLLSLSTATWVLAVALMAYGFFRAPIIPLADAAAMEELDGKNRGGYGRMRIWGSLGFVGGAWAAGWALDSWGHGAFAPAFAAGAVVCAAGAFLLPVTRVRKRTKIRAALRSLLRNRPLMFMIAGLFLARVASGAYNAFFAITLKERGASHLFVAGAWTLAIAAEIVVFLMAPWLLRRVRARSLLIFSVAVAAVRWAATGLVRTPNELLALQPLHAITFGALLLSAVAYLDEITPPELRNSAQSLYSAGTFGAGGVLGYLIWGPVIDAMGMNVAFVAAAGIAATGVLVLAVGSQRERQRR